MKIYVGNLPPSVSDQQLEALFATHGQVRSAQVVTDKFSGQSRGFAFVEMSDTDAQSAIRSLDGSAFEGSSLRVNEARPKEAGGGGGGGFRPRSGGNGNRYGGGRSGNRR